MSHAVPIGLPERSVLTHLRLEGAMLFALAVVLYATAGGGNWWMFALLLLAPDLSMLAFALGERIGAQVYNAAHNLAVPTLLALLGVLTSTSWLLPLTLVWGAHIAMDRALGFGLRYAGDIRLTHVGALGKARERAPVADTR